MTACIKQKQKRIRSEHLLSAIRNDEELKDAITPHLLFDWPRYRDGAREMLPQPQVLAPWRSMEAHALGVSPTSRQLETAAQSLSFERVACRQLDYLFQVRNSLSTWSLRLLRPQESCRLALRTRE